MRQDIHLFLPDIQLFLPDIAVTAEQGNYSTLVSESSKLIGATWEYGTRVAYDSMGDSDSCINKEQLPPWVTAPESYIPSCRLLHGGTSSSEFVYCLISLDEEAHEFYNFLSVVLLVTGLKEPLFFLQERWFQYGGNCCIRDICCFYLLDASSSSFQI